MKVLSLGSGKMEKQENVTRLDIRPETKPDVIWDLRKLPFPFEDKSFDEIQCLDVLEHLDNIPATMEECHRLLKPGGIIKISTPHFSCSNSYIDPTHKHHLSYFSLDYFTQSHKYAYYSTARFKVKQRILLFEGGRIYKGIFQRFANKYPEFYEKRLAWIFPAWFLYFELEAEKA